MSARLTLSLRGALPARLDMSAVTPGKIKGLSNAEIEALVVAEGRRPLRLGDCFKVEGAAGPQIVIAGSERLDFVGAGLDGGEIIIEGDCGAGLGADMSGGGIFCLGSAGPFAGAGMSGGEILIRGDAGDHLGGARHGRMIGMSGGFIAIGGAAGDHAGGRMRRGTIFAPRCGAFAGAGMIAGSLIAGEIGPGAGALMKRGTMLITGGAAPDAPGFVDCGRHDLAFLGLWRKTLSAKAAPWRPEIPRAVRRLQGDMGAGGLGEILIAI